MDRKGPLSAHRKPLVRGLQLGALLTLLFIGLPMAGTIWTRSANLIKIPRGVRLPFPNATYSTRDWNLAISFAFAG